MPRINPVDYARTEGHPKKLLDGVKRSLGATPNMATTMTGSVLDGWLSLSRALRHGSISALCP